MKQRNNQVCISAHCWGFNETVECVAYFYQNDEITGRVVFYEDSFVAIGMSCRVRNFIEMARAMNPNVSVEMTVTTFDCDEPTYVQQAIAEIVASGDATRRSAA